MVVVGASGVIGQAALRHFAAQPDTEVLGVSRRRPVGVDAPWAQLDLRDGAACRALLGSMTEVTHVVYAALYEMPGLVAGWRDAEHRAINTEMLRNALDPIIDAHGALEHVTLLQGTKAYGVHIDVVPMPARERSARHPHENFYFDQEDHLRARRAQTDAWTFTILRPQVVYGESLASPMNLIPAIGVYGAIRKARGLPLAFPGGAPRVSEAVDADLLARAIDWSGRTDAARDETFNVANGDVFVWRTVWPAIADALGMEVGPDEPMRLADVMPGAGAEWAAIVRAHGLAAPARLEDVVGDAFVYADLLFGAGVDTSPFPVLVSTVKIRQAGFADCVDTEDMFRRLIGRLQQRALLPPRHW